VPDTRLVGIGDTVVIVNLEGHLVRDQERRVMRGVILSIGPWRGATVLLARSGRRVPVSIDRLRRCPALAYCRPARLPGAA
jgi:hypothetical protein